MKKSGKKIIIVLSVLAVVAVAGVATASFFFPKQTVMAAYKTTTVAAADFTISIQGTGSIQSSNTKAVVMQQDGEVQNLAITDGAVVSPGQTLCTLYNETLETQIADQEDDIKQQNISVSKLKNSLGSYKFYAPIDGYVYNLKAAVGDSASAIANAYGSICQIVPNQKIQLVCTTSFAPLNVEHRNIDINQKVYLVPRFHANAVATEARISSVSGNTFTVEAPVSYSSAGTLTDVYFENTITIYYKIGEGTTQFIEPVSVTGSGVLSKIHVSENQQVQKGDLMFEFDAYEVQKSIQSSGITINGLQETLEKNKEKLADNAVVAEIGGTITGLTVTEGTNVNWGQTIATIVDTAAQEIVISVDELDIPKVSLAQKATLTIDALPEKEYEGTVTKIAEIGTVTNNITTFDVTIALNTTEGIKIGMSATAEILVEEIKGALFVPIDYIENFGNKKRIRVIPAGVNVNDSATWKSTDNGISVPYEWREVTIGSTNSESSVITDGLTAGDVIAIIDETAATTTTGFSLFGGGGGAMRGQAAPPSGGSPSGENGPPADMPSGNSTAAKPN